MATKIPNTYREPYGLPLSWRDEQSGQLATAIRAYLNNRVEGTPLDASDLELVRQFCEHFINAPCWDQTIADDEDKAVLLSVRGSVKKIRTVEELSHWIYEVLDLGIDPL